MIEQRTIICEGPDCDIQASTMMERPYLPCGWIGVFEWSHEGEPDVTQFCGRDCELRYAAQFPPPLIIHEDGTIVEGRENGREDWGPSPEDG